MMIVVCKVYSLPVSYCCAWLAKKRSVFYSSRQSTGTHAK